MPAHSKARLYLDLEFDDRLTDAEALASAMDRLLETALSVPSILEEYGADKVGTFRVFVESAPLTKTAPTVSKHFVVSGPLNWPLLNEQKSWLFGYADSYPEAAGLLHLVDAIQDAAVAQGGVPASVVFPNANESE